MQGFKDIANTIATVSDLPAFFIREKNIEVIRMGYLSRSSLNNLYRLMFRKAFTSLDNVKNPKVPRFLRYVNALNLSTLVILLSFKPVTSILMGPFYMDDVDKGKMVNDILDNSKARMTEFEAIDMVDSIPIKDSMFIQAWGRTVSRFMDVSNDSFIKIPTIYEAKEARDEVPTIAENRINETEIESHYSHEREIRKLVKLGDKARLKQLLVPKTQSDIVKAKTNSIYEQRVVGPNGLRKEKNFAIILNTLFRSSADDAGLPPVYIHSISEEVVADIERAQASSDLMHVIEGMIDRYCNSINNVSMQNHSVNVVKVQRYILSNIDKKITLGDLCDITNLDESYLCRLFKRECHITINEYIQNRRISEAKRILETTDTPVSYIATMLGYSSQSYFCSVFKNIVGVSPSKYKSNRGNFYKV